MMKIACVGDSLTFGYGAETTDYPSALQELLGEEYQVGNFGVNGACIAGDLPYRSLSVYRTSAEFRPDVVLMMLGSNDAKPDNWNETDFVNGFAELIRYYQHLDSNPSVWLLTAPSADEQNDWISCAILTGIIVPMQKRIAETYGCNLIDMHAETASLPENCYCDGVHFTDEGYRLIASVVADKLR